MATVSASAIDPDSLEAVKTELEKLLSNPKNYVANFYFDHSSADITDSEDVLIIDAEYPAIASILVKAEKEDDNFAFGEYDPETIWRVCLTIISENNQESSGSNSQSDL